MMTEEHVVESIVTLTKEELGLWVEEGWIHATRRRGQRLFREIDVARIRFICELREDFDVAPETIPLVLSLVDQIHGLRAQLRRLAAAVESQPAAVKRDIRRWLEKDGG